MTKVTRLTTKSGQGYFLLIIGYLYDVRDGFSPDKITRGMTGPVTNKEEGGKTWYNESDRTCCKLESKGKT